MFLQGPGVTGEGPDRRLRVARVWQLAGAPKKTKDEARRLVCCRLGVMWF